MKWLRFASQIAFTVAVSVAGIRLAFFNEGSGIERYCPFAGAETAWSLLTSGSLTCSAGALNLSLLLALIVSALVAKKAFCGWICPFGAVSEWLYMARKRLGFRSSRLDNILERHYRLLRGLRFLVLVAILFFTWRASEMVFRSFDPYYVMFSAGGHDVKWWSWLVLAVVLAMVVSVPLAWCRYLCPLGALVWPFARFSALRIIRNQDLCSSCGTCDNSCLPGIKVSSSNEVSSGDCTLCMECLNACPRIGTLDLATARGRRASPSVVPVTITLAAALGIFSADHLAFPSSVRDFEEARSQDATTVVLHVKGVRCARTASQALSQFDGEPGIIRAAAYGADGRVEVTFDSSVTNVEAIIKALEGPYLDPESGIFVYHRFKVFEVDGHPLDGTQGHLLNGGVKQ